MSSTEIRAGAPRVCPATPPSTLRNYRVALCLRQDDLAARAWIQTAWISRFERGVRTPTEDQKRRIAKALGANPADVFPEPPAAEGDDADRT